ncbi:MAG: hypothetical protein U5N86_06570 [Planctomycetota bacterium]|nr:hypothetical protein [Planctomycetota bacterium]
MQSLSDSPKGYQITQHFNPLARGGSLELRDGGLVRLRQIHIEEDSARLVHEGDKTLVDLNRCGAPLIEIVTEPDLSNGTETGEFLALLRRSLQFAGISDCDTQSGGFRVDINVSVCRGERVELNVGRSRAARNAVDVQAERQREYSKPETK